MSQEYIETYPQAARVIYLHLKEFCEEDRIFPDMIAEASRKAKREIDRLRQLISEAPRCNTTLPDEFQRLWESCITLSEKSEFKNVLRYLLSIEAELKKHKGIR